MRLQRYLAQAGVASRRRAEDLIAGGRVRVDGRIIREMGTIVAPGARVEVDGKVVEPAEERRYVVLHKPFGVMTTMYDPEGRRTIADHLPKNLGRVVPVGRLDYDTAGVLLLTNDGDLAHVLSHPRYGVEKTYRAVVQGRLDASAMQRLLAGISLDDGKTAPAKIRVVATARARSEIDVTIHEGRNRQVRRMLEAMGCPVLTLVRSRFGPIALGELPMGAVREVTEHELAALRRTAADSVRAAADAEPPPPRPPERKSYPASASLAPERARRRRFAVAPSGARPWR